MRSTTLIRLHDKANDAHLPQVDLRTALTSSWREDYFIQAVQAPGTSQRLSTATVGAMPITADLAIFDVDCRTEDGKKVAGLAPIEWRADLLTKVRALREATSQRPVFFFTAHGARILYRLASPIQIASESDCRGWRARYAAWIEHLENFGITADKSCDDVFRLHRLPVTARVGVDREALIASCPNRIQLYVPSHIGTWNPPLTDLQISHIKSAIENVRPHINRASHINSTLTSTSQSHDSILFRLFSNRGYVLGSSGDRICVRCPFDCHEQGSRSSTVIFRPFEAGALGGFLCAHESCRGRTAIEALNAFSLEEKRSAGVTVPARTDETVEVEVTAVTHGDQSLKISLGNRETWLPWSSTQIVSGVKGRYARRGDRVRVSVPSWLARREGLI